MNRIETYFFKLFYGKQKQDFERIVDIGKQIHSSNPDALFPYMRALLKKVQSDLFLRFLIADEHKAPETDTGLFFGLRACFYSGEKWLTEARLDERHEVDLREDIVISSPWMRQRFVNAMSTIGRECPKGTWRKDKNHYVTLLLPFRIAWFENGNHSSITGVLKQEGVAEADVVYDVTKLYNKIHTDGVFFYETSTGRRLSEVYYIEFAAAYELGRLIGNKSCCA